MLDKIKQMMEIKKQALADKKMQETMGIQLPGM